MVSGEKRKATVDDWKSNVRHEDNAKTPFLNDSQNVKCEVSIGVARPMGLLLKVSEPKETWEAVVDREKRRGTLKLIGEFKVGKIVCGERMSRTLTNFYRRLRPLRHIKRRKFKNRSEKRVFTRSKFQAEPRKSRDEVDLLTRETPSIDRTNGIRKPVDLCALKFD